MKQTHYIAVAESPPDLRQPAAFDQLHFRAWINTTREQRDVNLRLAVHQHLRFRGGFGDAPRLDFHVFDYFHDTPRYPSGRPRTLQSTLFTLHRTHAEDPRGLPVVL
jgi:hypothetical protein